MHTCVVWVHVHVDDAYKSCMQAIRESTSMNTCVFLDEDSLMVERYWSRFRDSRGLCSKRAITVQAPLFGCMRMGL